MGGAPVLQASGGAAGETGGGDPTSGPRAPDRSALTALCLVARLHQIAADPAHLAHQIGLAASSDAQVDDVLRAAARLGLKARRSRVPADRLALAALPALARMNDGRIVLLAQCDAQRVLIQDTSAPPAGGRPVTLPLADFSAQWTGELILVASRASLAGTLAKFDFSWFIPSLVRLPDRQCHHAGARRRLLRRLHRADAGL